MQIFQKTPMPVQYKRHSVLCFARFGLGTRGCQRAAPVTSIVCLMWTGF